MKRCMFVLFVVLAALWSINGHAQSCTGSPSNLNFGTISPVSGTSTGASSTITIRCSGFPLALPVRACVNLGVGSGGTTYAPRTALNGTSQLQYNLYADSAGGVVWGSRRTTSYSPVAVNIPLTSSGGTASGSATLTVYGRVPASQPDLVAGTYTSTFAGTAQAELDYQQYVIAAPSCATMSTPALALPFTVNASVINDCTISATNINFGTAGVLSTTLTATGTLTVACTNDDAYSIALSPGTGSGATVADRRMTKSGGNEQIRYQLYRNAAGTIAWGDGTSGTSTAAGEGTGTSQSFTVYARVLPQTTPSAGTYVDTIIATITY
ncbi:Csu type fimbrial protein [Caballeronia humi]|uniref:Secreted pili protein involved in motility and biofilm formation n=1 Tax=Caballeronia humi TaxID=326474 RepID=A0A158GAT6_9BURK|nr:spore coat U domain-containing protein [Caballeronia humi]SAL28951.1 secreted pili protein involved in motility and biofilm formation [Caballeronia humi]